jgi:DNA-binding transcriptional LysR family regulator
LRTQSAISLQMKRLEEQLGCRLFERGGRGVEPTQAGTMLLGYARRILAANDELVGRMAEPLVEGSREHRRARGICHGTSGAGAGALFPRLSQGSRCR